MEFNWSGINSKSFLGKLLRYPLTLIPRDAELRILQGKHRGLRWIAGSSNHGCWLGSYEYPKRRSFEKIVNRGSTVYDIGAHVGFYTLLSSVIVGDSGMVYAFEPLPDNLELLRRHININRLKNVVVFDCAVFSEDKTCRFSTGPSSSMGHITNRAGDIDIQAVALDSIVRKEYLKPPDFIKIDVEGAELDVFSGAEETIKRFRPVIFLATHSPNLHEACSDFLENHGYKLSSLDHRPLDKTDELLATPC